MVAMDTYGNLSGSCTTSGAGFKMRGRVGDSPIIGAGLYVDNEVGACVATGQGEDVIRIAGAHTVVEYMRQGLSPGAACKKAVERVVKIKKEMAKDIQVAFIALNKAGQHGAFSIHSEFSYALRNSVFEKMVDSKFLMK
jgi:N4-(beta-N-acetylglucosaminyl)-L-asparaginase